MREFEVVNFDDRVFGAHAGAYWLQESAGGDGHIDADNDSVMSPKLEFIIDLSEATSHIMGRQASMMAAYRIHSISVGIRPVDDTADNDESAFFAGRWLMFPHTKHGEEMLNSLEALRKHLRRTMLTETAFSSLLPIHTRDFAIIGENPMKSYMQPQRISLGSWMGNGI